MQLESIIQYIKLLRLDKPTGFLLLFWPCAFGLALGKTDGIDWGLMALFFMGSIIMRSAGCVINDIIDRDIDKQVERTKTRPIASGVISVSSALVVCAILCAFGLFILLQLNLLAILIGLFSVLLIAIYPFMKRIFNYPQLFLAVTFNIGALMAYASVRGEIDFSVELLYAACCFWTLGYDTIYGHQDKKFDKALGVRSTAITFEKYTKPFLCLCYSAMIGILIYIGSNVPLMSLACLHCLWQIYTLKPDNPADCLKKFNSNAALGALIFMALWFV